jgi:hypothetical protein
MGGQSRYKVSMFDHQWRVLLVDEAEIAKPELVFGTEVFEYAVAAYDAAVKDNPGRLVQLRQRSRIVRRSDRPD